VSALHAVGPERGVDRARLDEQDPDAVLADVVGQRPGVALDRFVVMSGSFYSFEQPPMRPSRSARAYVLGSSKGRSPVASVAATYSSIRFWVSLA
jgi:hypothetical protein